MPDATTPSDIQPLTTPPAKPSEVIQSQASSQDYVILRFAVVGLTLIAIIAIVGSLLLIRQNKEVQAGVTAIIALAGVAVGGLVTMLTRVPLVPAPAPTSGNEVFGRRKV